MTQLRNCHEQNSEKWEDENIHCLHTFLRKNSQENDGKVE